MATIPLRHNHIMTDLKSLANPLFLREDELRQGIELLFYAYRDFTRGPDEILERFGFGRAHHRALHFIGGNPGITVAELLGILRITKQSLSRVLSALIEGEFVRQQQGTRDRRQRQLSSPTRARRWSGSSVPSSRPRLPPPTAKPAPKPWPATARSLPD